MNAAEMQKAIEAERAARLASEARLTRMELNSKTAAYIALAKADLEPLGNPEDIGAVLTDASQSMSAENFRALLQMLKGASTRLALGKVFDPRHQRGEAEEKIEALAKECVKAGIAKTLELGKLHVLSTNPELYAAYRAEREDY